MSLPKQIDYMKRFAFICIPTVFVIVVLLLGFQDSIKTIGGGFALAAPGVVAFGVFTWYAWTHSGDFTYFAIRIAIVLDALLVLFVIIMLVHVQQEINLHKATGLLLHLAPSNTAI